MVVFGVFEVLLLVSVHVGTSAGTLRGSASFNISDEEALERAREVLTAYPLVDGHNDMAIQFRRKVKNQVNAVNLSMNVDEQWGPTHTDIPRLREGMVGGQFWALFGVCSRQNMDVVRSIFEQVDVARRFIAQYPNDFTLVTTAQGIEDAFADGKIGSLLGVEGGHNIDSSLALIRILYDQGVRYMGLTHECTTPWSDCRLPEQREHDGLTEWGELVVQEMNRLGMIVDLSHTSVDTMKDALAVSQAPVMFSHSNAWTLCNSRRNVPDDVLDMTAENGGIVMVAFVEWFLNCPPSDDSVYDLNIIVDHMEYIRDRIGIDHVGIGADYDGTTRIPPDLADVSRYPYLFAELVKRGWSNEDMEKVAGRNIVRVLQAVEEVRDQLAYMDPLDEWIPDEDVEGRSDCRRQD